MAHFLHWGVVEKLLWVNDKPHRSCPQDPPWALAQVVGGSHLAGLACPLCLLFVPGMSKRLFVYLFIYFAGVIEGVVLLESLISSVLA